MDIVIKDENASQRYLEASKKFRDAYKDRYVKIFLYYGTICIGATTLGIYEYNGQLNFPLGIGFLSTFVLIYNIYIAFRNLERSKKLADKLALNYYQEVNTRTLTINDEGITDETLYSKKEVKWRLITSYMLFGNYLILIQDSNLYISTLIDKRLIKEEDFNELHAFLSRNKQKTIDWAHVM